MKNIFIVSFVILFLLIFSSPISAGEINRYSYKIINTYPHDKNAFTQGLYYENGIIYEGTGQYGESDLRKYKLVDNKIIKKHELSIRYFGEGITVLDNKIYQSTWKAKTIFIYDKEINLLEKTSFPFECWGLTDNDKDLIMSNGTNTIRFLDSKNFKVLDKIEVTLDGEPIKDINELEYINNKIYANIWQEDYIVIIEPSTGNVSGVINLQGIINPNIYDYQLNVLNGIAYDKKNDRLFVTGKLWPLIFEIELVPVD